MSTVSAIFVLLFYAAAGVFVIGVGGKLLRYARTPAPLKIPTTPAPTTRAGMVLRLLRELLLFESLFKATKTAWVLGWTFHAALALVLLGHLRYFTEPVWAPAAWVQGLMPQAGLVMLAALTGLWMRRLLADRVRHISAASDHLMLALLIATAATGVWMLFVSHSDVVAVKAFTLGLLELDWQTLPLDGALLLHLVLASMLITVFPLSKLMHAPGLFFSPTRNQVDDARERRHRSPWTAELGAGRD